MDRDTSFVRVLYDNTFNEGLTELELLEYEKIYPEYLRQIHKNSIFIAKRSVEPRGDYDYDGAQRPHNS